jgi:DNA-binding IclR family transcriptional regulator
MDVLANDSESGRDSNKATARILKVFSSFASDAAKFGVTELSHQLGMTKNMVHRALQTLADQGYLMRDASGSRYQLSYRVLELQNHGVMEPDFRTLCQPYVQAIYRLTGETVSVLVRSLDYAVFIDGVETRKTGVWRMPIGGLRPLHSTASGRAMLAYSTTAKKPSAGRSCGRKSRPSVGAATPSCAGAAICPCIPWRFPSWRRKGGCMG